MKDENKFQIPKSRKDKIELLKAISKGEKKIEDIMDPTFEITLWFPEGDYFRNQNGDIITAKQHEAMMSDKNIQYVTLILD